MRKKWHGFRWEGDGRIWEALGEGKQQSECIEKNGKRKVIQSVVGTLV